MDTLSTFRELLQAAWLERFVQLSCLLLEDDTLKPWLARAYFCTLLTGALAPADLPDDAAATPYQDAVRDFLQEVGLPSPPARGLAHARDAVDEAARHLAPVGNVSPFGHNAPFPYTAPYALADVGTVLEQVPDLLTLNSAARATALGSLLIKGLDTSPVAPTMAVARSILALWHTSAILGLGPGLGYPIKTAPIECYPASRVWAAIGGNPMGVPGPYYGNWAYPALVPVTDSSLDLSGGAA